ncbi:hypothetical protein J6590_034876 [Homalodisca vitripennis]|nr:hypothetical protein J6590_034876 [Homalodisca vitripennis]
MHWWELPIPVQSAAVRCEQMNRKVAGVAESQPQVAGRTRLVLGCLLIVAVLAVVVPVYYWLTTDPPSTGVCSVDLSIPLTGRVQPNGSIVDQGEVFPKGYYFQKNGTTLGCLCALKSCIRKCCALDETFFSPNGRSSFDCVKIPSASQFFKFSSVVHNSAVEMVNVTKNHFGVLFGDACHHGKFWLDPSASPADKTYLMMDGRILLYGRNHEEIYFDASKYCLESVNGSEVIYTFLCVQPVEDAQTKAKYIFYPIGMLLSIPFLFATFIVYAIIPDLHGNPHGKSIMSHILSLLTGYVTLTVIQLMGKNMPGFWCFSLALIDLEILLTGFRYQLGETSKFGLSLNTRLPVKHAVSLVYASKPRHLSELVTKTSQQNSLVLRNPRLGLMVQYRADCPLLQTAAYAVGVRDTTCRITGFAESEPWAYHAMNKHPTELTSEPRGVLIPGGAKEAPPMLQTAGKGSGVSPGSRGCKIQVISYRPFYILLGKPIFIFHVH